MKKIINNHLIMSGFYKAVSGLAMFFSIRLLINYLGSENYGIWVLVFTLFQLVLLMDFGVQSSLKTKIPVFVHKKDWVGLNSFIGSIYKLSFAIAIAVFIFFIFFIKVFDIKSAFNILELSFHEVNFLFLLNLLFFCLTFIANIHKSLYVAFHKGKFAEQSIALNQLFFLVALIFSLEIFQSPITGYQKLVCISFINGGVSLLVNLYFTFAVFKKEKLRISLLKNSTVTNYSDVFQLGLKFMIIQIGFLFVFSSDSYIISYVFNPTEIVPYEVVSKLFQLPYLVLFAALTPFWSLFAKHYLEKNQSKLLNDFNKFNKFFSLVVLGLIVMTFITPVIIPLWIKDTVKIPRYLILLTAVVTGLKIFVNYYILFLSGIGKLNFYLTVLAISILIKIPLSYFFVDLGFGINSVLLSSLVIVGLWALIIPFKCYQITKAIKNNE
jgi:O-antigen/teichoic acid export membrane protein